MSTISHGTESVKKYNHDEFADILYDMIPQIEKIYNGENNDFANIFRKIVNNIDGLLIDIEIFKKNKTENDIKRAWEDAAKTKPDAKSKWEYELIIEKQAELDIKKIIKTHINLIEQSGFKEVKRNTKSKSRGSKFNTQRGRGRGFENRRYNS